MNRPLAWFCAAFLVYMVIMHQLGSRENGSPYISELSSLAEELQSEQHLLVQGTVSECSEVSKGVRLSMDHLTIQRKDLSKKSLSSEIKINVTIKNHTLMPGDRLWLEGNFSSYEEDSNPGQFDASDYYMSQKVIGMLEEVNVQKVYRPPSSAKQFLYHIRSAFHHSYGKILGSRYAEIISAVTLGEKGGLENQWKDQYQEGGIAHVLAISGLHISLIGMAVYRFLRKTGCGFVMSSLFSALVLCAYGVMSGNSVSGVRALLMFLLWLGSQVLGRKYDMATALSVTAALLAITNPENIFQSSFLLSFSAISSLAFLYPVLEKTWDVKNPLGKALLTSLSVNLGTLPCTMYFFCQISPWSIFLNLLVIPLMSVLMSSGLAASSAAMFSVKLGIFLAAPVNLILTGFDWLCQLERCFPSAVFVTGSPSLLRIFLYYMVLAGAIVLLHVFKIRDGSKIKYRKLLLRGIWICCTLLCLFLMLYERRTEAEIICLDVGQGDCSLVMLPTGENCLIDGGSSSERNIWEYVIEPALKYYGIRTIDYIFLTHADKDHINGVEEYLDSYECGFGDKNIHGISVSTIVLPICENEEDFSELKNLACQKKIKVITVDEGDCIGNGTWSFSCLSPSKDRLTGVQNEDSLVLMMTYGKFKMLFTGDLEGQGEENLTGSGWSLKADVLKVGHHGSAAATSEQFLQKVRPQVSVVSCGKENPYGHPSEETIKRLKAAGCTIFSTMESGAISILTDGGSFSVDKYKKIMKK